MEVLSKELICSYSKIENWFKRQRREDVKLGKLSFEVFLFFYKNFLKFVKCYI